MFTALAEDFGQLKDKINLFVALAPITNLGGSNDKFFHTLAVSLPMVKGMLKMIGMNEMFGDDWDTFSGGFCMIFSSLCDTATI